MDDSIRINVSFVNTGGLWCAEFVDYEFGDLAIEVCRNLSTLMGLVERNLDSICTVNNLGQKLEVKND